MVSAAAAAVIAAAATTSLPVPTGPLNARRSGNWRAGGAECWPHRLRQAAADPPPGARERLVGDGGEALLVGAQREEEVRDAIRARQVRVVDADAEAVDAPLADEQSARLADQPRAEPARLLDEPGPRVEVARVVVDEVPQEPERRPLRLVGLARLRADDLGAAVGVQLGDRPRLDERERGGGRKPRLDRDEHRGGDEERDDVREGRRGPGARVELE